MPSPSFQEHLSLKSDRSAEEHCSRMGFGAIDTGF